MGFQSGINQLLGMGAIFSQLPAGQDMKKFYNASHKRALAQKQYNEILKKVPANTDLSAATEGEREAYFNTVQQGREAARQRFESRPNQETLERYISSIDTSTSRAQYNREQAMLRVQQLGQSQVEQLDEFEALRQSFSNDELPAYSGPAFSGLSREEQDDIIRRYLNARGSR